jgi:hypothetical protein
LGLSAAAIHMEAPATADPAAKDEHARTEATLACSASPGRWLFDRICSGMTREVGEDGKASASRRSFGEALAALRAVTGMLDAHSDMSLLARAPPGSVIKVA